MAIKNLPPQKEGTMKDYSKLSWRTKYQQGDRSPEVVRLWNAMSRDGMKKYRATNESLTARLKDNAQTLHAQAVKRTKKAGGYVTEDAKEVKKIKELYLEVSRINHTLGRKEYCVDHIVAISNGGGHCLDNLQILTISENSKKYHQVDKKMKKMKSIRPKMISPNERYETR